MKLIIEGETNRFYVQTLCLIFFPGAKFSEDEDESAEQVTLRVHEREDGIAAEAEIRVGDRVVRADGFAPFLPELTRQRTAKIAEGRAIYSAGCTFFDCAPPWGILTGVRPSKVAREYLSGGFGLTKTRTVLRNDYLLTPKKASLVVDVASCEMRLIKNMRPNTCSVYISIPFCPSRCAYCSFVSYTSKRLLDLIPAYVDRLLGDIDGVFETIRELGMQVSTVYIGGGTPTVLHADKLERVLERVARHVDPATLEEYTVEAGRPDTITAEKLAVCKKYGVSRISVNTQTLNDDVLHNIGRHHTSDDFFRAFELTRESGIPYINTDLIAGLPGEDFSSFAHSIDRVIELRPENLTVHTFCVKRAAELLQLDPKIYHRESRDAAKSVDYSQIKAKMAGYRPYYMYRQKNTVGNLENVGFALAGTEGLYNVYMMEETHSIFAAGAGAVTKLVETEGNMHKIVKIDRIFNPKYPYEYLRDGAGEMCGLREDATRRRILSFFGKEDAGE